MAFADQGAFNLGTYCTASSWQSAMEIAASLLHFFPDHGLKAE